MANVYYSDTLGTNLNVFEKKTKGGEPFYYIYLNKTKINESDVGKLTKIMQDTIPQATIKTKKGKIAYQVTWSYNSATPLMSEQKIFDAMFSYLVTYGYVDNYQGKGKKASSVSTPPPTPTPTTQNIDFEQIPDKVLKEGDEFYFNAKLKIQKNIFIDTLKVYNIDSSNFLDISWTDKNGQKQDIKHWISTTEAQRFVFDGTITFPKGTSNSFNYQFNDILWYNGYDFPYQIFRIKKVDVANDVFTYQYYNSSSQRFIDNVFKISDVVQNIITDITFKKLEVGDQFETRSLGNKYIITKIETIGQGGKNITFDSDGISQVGTELDFIEEVQQLEMKWVKTNVVAQTSSTSTTPMQVGDKFIFCDIPFKPTKQELDNVRKVIKINTNTEELTFEFKSGDELIIDFDVIRKGIDEGECIIISSANQSAQTQASSSQLKSLRYYDLISRVGDGKLFRVINVVGVLANKFDVFLNIDDIDDVVLEDYDSIAKNFSTQYIPFEGLKKNFADNRLKYLGQIKIGDSFVSNDYMLERFVTKVEDYPHDVEFMITDLNVSPPNVSGGGTEVMNVFTKSLLKQNFKYNLALGNTTNATNPTPQVTTNVTPKPQISNSEINALKKELSDLIFLKSGVSDLDFEEKMNISSEIYDVQKKVNDLNEKLFEQSVGDEQFFDKLFEQSFTPLRDRYDLVITENNLNELLSPNGEISDLNEDLQVIVNSKEFKEWFGDWRNAFFYRNLPDFGGLNISKVLNDKFEPQIVWHGTNNEFSYFDFENFPANYFAVNKEYSEFFATNKGSRGYVLPFFLDIKNPLDLSSFGNNFVSTKDFFDWMYLMTGMSAEELEVNPLFLDPNLQPNPIWVYIRNNATMLKKIAQGRVYDGIKFYEFNPNEENNPDKNAYETLAYIIFDPHQAKLADPSRGEILLASLKSFMLKRGGKI
jgi:hypothetical protein